MCAERRGVTRYDLALPVYIGDAQGLTRNIGIGGALVISPLKFEPDDPIDVIIEITFSDPYTPTRLHCTGRVRRIRKLRAAYALALEFTDVRVLTQTVTPHSHSCRTTGGDLTEEP